MNTVHDTTATPRPCCGAIDTHTDDCPGPDWPVPAGATADDWPMRDANGNLIRCLVWLDLGDVAVTGLQYGDDGRIEDRGIAVYVGDGRKIDATRARGLAAQLIEAADALEALQ